MASFEAVFEFTSDVALFVQRLRQRGVTGKYIVWIYLAIALIMASSIFQRIVLYVVLVAYSVASFSGISWSSQDHETDTPKVNKKGPSRKVRRRGNTRRKRNRDLARQEKENMADPPDGTDLRKFHPSEENDNHKVKRKSILTSRPVAEACSNQNKVVKIYSPLKIFIELDMQPKELFSMFQQYVLNQEDLMRNGFPPYPRNLGSSKFSAKKSDPTQRWCCRCGEKYTVTDDGEYQSDTVCCYHKGKRQGAGPFSCCGYNMREGCVTNRHHVSSITKLKTVKFVKTREKKQVSAQHQVFALDCEMCYTCRGMEITRVSVVGMDGTTVYDTFVLPESPITDYNTEFSGITAKHLKDVKTTLPDVQAFLLKLLSAKTVLVGHALENDLNALCIIHETIVDTSVVFPHKYGPRYKSSLKSLAENHLQRKIQCGSHDSVEDARTCIELMLKKVKSDKEELHNSSFQSTVPQQWSASPISINAPYNVAVWRPTLVSPYDFYLGGQVTA